MNFLIMNQVYILGINPSWRIIFLMWCWILFAVILFSVLYGYSFINNIAFLLSVLNFGFWIQGAFSCPQVLWKDV